MAVRFGRCPPGPARPSPRRHVATATTRWPASGWRSRSADGVVSAARASFVSVTDVPFRARPRPRRSAAEPVDAALDAAAEAVREHVEPEGDIHASADYRRMLVAELTAPATLPEAGTTAQEPRHD